MAKAPKATVNERRRQVLQLSLKGMKPHQIAKHFDVHPKTIKRDFEEIRKQQASKESQLTGWAMMGLLSEKQRQRLVELWRIVNDDKTTRSEKIRAIAEMRQEDEFAVRRAQVVGILPKDNITVLPPIQGDNNDVQVQQQVNIYQTLLSIKQQEEKLQNDQQKKEGGKESKKQT